MSGPPRINHRLAVDRAKAPDADVGSCLSAALQQCQATKAQQHQAGRLGDRDTEGTHVVERWAFSKDRLTIDRTMTIHDPYYSNPLVRQRGSARRDSLEVFEPAPCDPDGYFRDLLETGRLEQHLDQ